MKYSVLRTYKKKGIEYFQLYSCTEQSVHKNEETGEVTVSYEDCTLIREGKMSP